MSDQQRSTIEGALSALRGDSKTASASQQPALADASAGTDTAPRDSKASTSVEQLTQRLRRLGFDAGDVEEALAQCGLQPSASAALDWLCLHVPHERLPKDFAAGADRRSASSTRHNIAPGHAEDVMIVLLS
jgi:peptidoglycan hydrolase-like protein with peptidoglycan-binding domain